MEQERIVGNVFEVNAELRLNDSVEQLAEEDNLETTVNYAEVVGVIRDEMSVKSALLENVAWRIVKSLKKKFSLIEGGKIEIIKTNPPIGVETDGTGVEIAF